MMGQNHGMALCACRAGGRLWLPVSGGDWLEQSWTGLGHLAIEDLDQVPSLAGIPVRPAGLPTGVVWPSGPLHFCFLPDHAGSMFQTASSGPL